MALLGLVEVKLRIVGRPALVRRSSPNRILNIVQDQGDMRLITRLRSDPIGRAEHLAVTVSRLTLQPAGHGFENVSLSPTAGPDEGDKGLQAGREQQSRLDRFDVGRDGGQRVESSRTEKDFRQLGSVTARKHEFVRRWLFDPPHQHQHQSIGEGACPRPPPVCAHPLSNILVVGRQQ
jgi:hypothetical protein